MNRMTQGGTQNSEIGTLGTQIGTRDTGTLSRAHALPLGEVSRLSRGTHTGHFGTHRRDTSPLRSELSQERATSQNLTCPPCNGNCQQGRQCPAQSLRARISPPEIASIAHCLLTGGTVGAAVASAWYVVASVISGGGL